MDSANFIPLGTRGGAAEAAPSGAPSGYVKIIGETKEERKRIAREIRLAAKKVHKKAKQDAKKARKLNGIMHRRMTRNNEKYVKNKDRNRQRAIDQERYRIQIEAVHQAERLAAKHDPTGKMFNVGEVVVLPDGKVKSKEALRKAEEQRERNAAEAKVKKEEEAKRALEKAAKKEAAKSGNPSDDKNGLVPEGVNPERAGLLLEPPKKISKTQQKRQEMLKPKPVPPKPVIPGGITLPEDEEDFIALWDITDQDIEKRLQNQKRKKKEAAKNLRRIQKEQKKFNRAMKVLKKQAAKAGILWDPVKAKAKVLGMFEEEANDKDSDDSDSNSDSDSDSDSSSESDNEDSPKNSKKSTSEEVTSNTEQPKKKIPQFSRPRLDLSLLEKYAKIEQERKEKKRQAKLKRRADRVKAAAEEEAKKAAEEASARLAEEEAANKTSEMLKDIGVEKSSKKKRKHRDDEDPNVALEQKVHDDEEKKFRKSKKVKVETQEEVEHIPEEPKKAKKEKSKKRKPEADEDVDPAPEELKKEKKHKSKKSKILVEAGEEAENGEANGEGSKGFRHSAEQWNPDALAGGDARKDKFLRLLGAGKKGSQDRDEERREKKLEKRAAQKAEEISKVENELERQFESGIKMKEAGGKRRGLGA